MLFALLVLLGILVFIYYYMTKNFDFFSSRGIPEFPPSFPFGSPNARKLILRQVAFTQMCTEIYKKYSYLPMVGFFLFSQPNIQIHDLELAKQIMIKDFDSFTDRRSLFTSNSGSNVYFNKMLTNLKGEEWKQMRQLISPLFTSGKLRAMDKLLHRVNDDLVQHLETYAESGEAFDAKIMMIHYTADTIASCGYGIEGQSFTNSQGIYRKMVAKLLNPSLKRSIYIFMIFVLPALAKLLKLSFIEEESTNFFLDLIRTAMSKRKEAKTVRNDMVSLFIDALDELDKKEKSEGERKLENEITVVSNALLLLFAGFDTTSTVLALSMYYLVKNPDVQEDLHCEYVDACKKADSDHLDMSTIFSLPMLDAFIHETLRMYPLTQIERVCTKDYRVEKFQVTIPKGVLVQIPIDIMHDSKYFDDPQNFNIDHFSNENKNDRSQYAYLGFGHGPRNCVGMRFALLQVKNALGHMLKNFKIIPCEKTVNEVIPDPTNMQPKGSVWVKVQKR